MAPARESTKQKPFTSNRISPAAQDAHPAFVWLTRIALGLSAALMIARATIVETNTSPFDASPIVINVDPPRGAGPAEGLMLDLLACVPPLLVLTRRGFDPSFRLRCSWSQLPMGLLALWAFMSPLWAADRFAAAIAASHWAAALVMLWAVSQSVRRWLHFRIVAALCFGLLLALSGHALYYKWVDAPDLRANLAKMQAEAPSTSQPVDFARTQFQNRIDSDDLSAFSISTNTFGAQLVVLTMILAGAIVQLFRLREGRRAWIRSPNAALVIAPAFGIVLALALIPLTESRTAVATVVLGAVAIAATLIFGDFLHRHSRLAYALAIGAVAGVVAAVVRYGITHHRLFHESLTFRWRYWDGASRVFRQHWLLGVGWDNFSQFYVGQRTLDATEEPRDPHNFAVRFFTELGLIGGVLALGWLLRLTRELTTPGLLPPDIDTPSHRQLSTPPAITTIFLICITATLISTAASLDFSTDGSFIIMELLGRFGLLCLLVVGSAFAAIRDVRKGETDERPAPWILYAMLIGLGLFLVHNTIDFSLFENGALYLFSLLCGAALGVRLGGAQVSNEQTRSTTRMARFALGVGVVAWLAAAGAFVVPVVLAESAAATADRELRHNQPSEAAENYAAALRAVPYNADYAFRSSQADFAAGRAYRDMIDRAVSLDPESPRYVLSRAKMNLAQRPRDRLDEPRILADFDRATALDPQNSDMWLEAAAGYEALGHQGGAIERYAHALDMNSRIDPRDNDRLTDARVAEVKAKLEQLGGRSVAPQPAGP